MKTIKANVKEDVILLSTLFIKTPKQDQWKLASNVIDLGLMNLRGFSGTCFKIVKKIRGREGVFSTMFYLNLLNTKTINQFIIDTAYHIVYGMDKEDFDSVGGWSQREIDLLLTKISFSSLESINDEIV